MTMTQTERVYMALQSGPLTSVEAFTLLGIVHLPRRILDLRELGAIIDTEQVHGYNRHGRLAHWTVYKLNKGSPALDDFAKPVKPKKSKHDFYLLGLMRSARILIDSADLEAAKAALGSEIRRRAKREVAKVRGS